MAKDPKAKMTGRPPKDGRAAMTPAERQRQYRERRKAQRSQAEAVPAVNESEFRIASDRMLRSIYTLEKLAAGWDRESYFNGIRNLRSLEWTLEHLRLSTLGEAAKDSRFWQQQAEARKRKAEIRNF